MNRPQDDRFRGLPLIANLAICTLYVMAVVALSGDRKGRLDLGQDGAVLLLCFLSPALIWAVIAWIASRKPLLSALSLLISAPLMVLGLLGRYADWKSFHDSVPGQEAQSIAGFLGMILQWSVGAIWLVAVVVVRVIGRAKASEGQSGGGQPPG